jgi:hypothetical protein
MGAPAPRPSKSSCAFASTFGHVRSTPSWSRSARNASETIDGKTFADSAIGAPAAEFSA